MEARHFISISSRTYPTCDVTWLNITIMLAYHVMACEQKLQKHALK